MSSFVFWTGLSMLRTSTIFNSSFIITPDGSSTFRSFFLAEMSFFGVFDGIPYVWVYGVTSVERWAPLGWLIARIYYGPHLPWPIVSGTWLMDKVYWNNFHDKKISFRSIDGASSVSMIGYKESVGSSGDSWLINSKTLLRASAILANSFGHISNSESIMKSLFLPTMSLLRKIWRDTLCLGKRWHFNWVRQLF